MVIAYFDPQPAPGDLPPRMPSPFAVPPHPIALRAVDELVRRVDAREGKMYGVLVVRDGEGRYGYLSAFSGMRDGSWHAHGFVGPTFDLEARDAFWPAGEAELAALDDELAVLMAATAPLRRVLVQLQARQTFELEALRERHRENRAARRDAREGATEDRLHELAQLSRGDSAERDRLDLAHATSRADLVARVSTLDRAIAELEQRKADRSRHWLAAIHGTYAITSARGETRSLASLFAPHSPPGGAGDCAAPKLIAHAQRRGLVPIALAEIWLGPPPSTGDRRAGVHYPACRGKCGPILAHALDGIDCDPAPLYGADPPIGDDEPRVVFEDDWIVVVEKPVGLLSIPGRGNALADCVAKRLRDRFPDATGPLVVHRLDLETSGLLLAAKDPATHADLQGRFARREIAKRYVALLEGVPPADRGTIELALRVDIDDRPRQIVDAEHGKQATTHWSILAREGPRTRVLLQPLTGRTHQLRVHCSHHHGLGAPIVGDRLYGRPGERLCLHAMSLVFDHPCTGNRIELVSEVPF